LKNEVSLIFATKIIAFTNSWRNDLTLAQQRLRFSKMKNSHSPLKLSAHQH